MKVMHGSAKITAEPKPTGLARRVKLPARAGCRDALDAPKPASVSLLLFILFDATCACVQMRGLEKQEQERKLQPLRCKEVLLGKGQLSAF